MHVNHVGLAVMHGQTNSKFQSGFFEIFVSYRTDEITYTGDYQAGAAAQEAFKGVLVAPYDPTRFGEAPLPIGTAMLRITTTGFDLTPVPVGTLAQIEFTLNAAQAQFTFDEDRTRNTNGQIRVGGVLVDNQAMMELTFGVGRQEEPFFLP